MVLSFKNLPNNISLCDNLCSFYSAKTILCLPVGKPLEEEVYVNPSRLRMIPQLSKNGAVSNRLVGVGNRVL
jgi:hypothetical protein